MAALAGSVELIRVGVFTMLLADPSEGGSVQLSQVSRWPWRRTATTCRKVFVLRSAWWRVRLAEHCCGYLYIRESGMLDARGDPSCFVEAGVQLKHSKNPHTRRANHCFSNVAEIREAASPCARR